ncbi:MAG TPA: DUF2157 domain-containing protein [Nitrospirae bacterium]|nr:DUF2157 domain-containing protein [Nitrospirota bacterium]
MYKAGHAGKNDHRGCALFWPCLDNTERSCKRFVFQPNASFFFGSTLVSAGIVFLFAYNWTSMNKFLKLGIIGLGIVVCIAASYILGTDRQGSKVLILSAPVLVGGSFQCMDRYTKTGQTPLSFSGKGRFSEPSQ